LCSMGCGTSTASRDAEVINDKGAIGLLTANGAGAGKTDLIAAATTIAGLQKLLQDEPYLDPAKAKLAHPLHPWVTNCIESLNRNKIDDAKEYLKRVNQGLDAEVRSMTEAFKRFDDDGSGNLDKDEFKHLCAYLGWGHEEADPTMLDVDGDNKFTIRDFKTFVGTLGGLQKLFEKRRARATASRQDVCDFAGVSVGSRVRAHFFVNGQKSKSWKEAQVLAVGVERTVGPPGQGVMLEFGFDGSSSGSDAWRAKQVVPPSWVVSSVEDAAVAAALREVGILDEQQGFWSLLLPESEMRAVERLESCQRAALSLVRKQATASHEQALPGLRDRFAKLGFGPQHLQSVLDWIQDMAPMVVHVFIDKIGPFFEVDDFYRNQFETKTSCGAIDGDNQIRKDWEHDLFGGAYDAAKPFDRCKYGALNIMNDYRGVVSANFYGDSYLVLKDARLRCTFAATDSGGIQGSRLAVLDKYAHVLAEYNDNELRSLVDVAMAVHSPESTTKRLDSKNKLRLLRGGSEDPAKEWITVGFPGLPQNSGSYYFEVLVKANSEVPQIGLASTEFERTAGAKNGQGVGDDAHSWGVDGCNAARWHNGNPLAWGVVWDIKKDIVVGVAVDLHKRTVWVSTNGAWDETPVFGPNEIPAGVSLYPAMSVKGRAGINLGPDFQHEMPKFAGSFQAWPGGAGGVQRLDHPELGNSEVLSVYKEIQIHGELNLKRNVQRLVANPKFRNRSKTQRSFALRVTTGSCKGKYERAGSHDGKPYWREENKESVIYWSNSKKKWCIHDKEKFDEEPKFWAPEDDAAKGEPPARGWQLPDSECGILDHDIFQKALADAGVSAADVGQVLTALKSSETHDLLGWHAGRNLVFRRLKGRLFEDEWKKLEKPPISAKDAWDLGVKATQAHLLEEAGWKGAQIIETKHPYEAKPDNWRKEVLIEGSSSLRVHFSKKCVTYDDCASLKMFAGGLHRNAAGKGARVEITPLGTTSKVWGTVAAGGAGGKTWTISLDRSHHAPQEEAEAAEWPSVGDEVQAKSQGGQWCRATVVSIEAEADAEVAGSDGAEKAGNIVIAWLDGDDKDVHKTRAQLRRPPHPKDDHKDLEDLKRYGHIPKPGEAVSALCHEEPAYADVIYKKGQRVGDEISAFKLDRASPLAPITVASLSSSGPAVEHGVEAGWFLDLEACIKGNAKKPFMEMMSGVGDFKYEKGMKLNAELTESCLKAVFDNLDAVVSRLNEKLLAHSTGIRLHFCNGCSKEKVKLLPEAIVEYVSGAKVGDEIRSFKRDGLKLRVEGFKGPGPARTAGVRSDWVVDICRTLGLHNPGKAPALTKQEMLEDPSKLLELTEVTLIFSTPNPDKTKLFEVFGGADRWTSKELPGDVAEFQWCTDGDGASEEKLRWGFWALVLSGDSPETDSNKIDEFLVNWDDATMKATGAPEELKIERDTWDEARLRALCNRHGWEFAWMTEDGERRRLAEEMHCEFGVSGGVVTEATEAVRKHVAETAEAEETNEEPVLTMQSQLSCSAVPDGAVGRPTSSRAGHPGGTAAKAALGMWKSLQGHAANLRT